MAAQVGLKAKTVRSHASNGNLGARKIAGRWRFTQEDVDAWNAPSGREREARPTSDNLAGRRQSERSKFREMVKR